MSSHRAPPDRPAREAPDPERMLLALADHLHEHCECRPGATGGARCPACDLRAQLRDVREQLLTWGAEGRRIAQRRDDAIGNGHTHLSHLAGECGECAALTSLAEAVRRHSSPTSSA